MKSRPILFSAPMVNALLAGTKSQTRRIMNPQPRSNFLGMEGAWWGHKGTAYPIDNRESTKRKLAGVCPHGEPGDTLWVRETWRAEELEEDGLDGVRFRSDDTFVPIENTRKASEKWLQASRKDGCWRPSIFMPRWASRLTLELTSVRVERLQDISQADAWAEGVSAERERLEAAGATTTDDVPSARREYQRLWESINGPGSWALNPWVWCLSFRRVAQRADEVAA